MSQKDDYNKELPAMEALASNQVKSPNMPVEIATQEAEDQYQVALKYQEQLATAGMTTEVLDTLKSRANALREAEAQWRIIYNSQQANIKNWNEQEPVGIALQKELKNVFRYAFRNDAVTLAKVREIANGKGDKDMIQDLLEYAVLGNSNPDPLTAVNFDLTKLDTATSLSETLSQLLAKATTDKQAQHKYKNTRDRAYTIMKQTLDQVRDCGKFVFIDQPTIKKMFASAYARKHRDNNKDAEQE
ncbi:hypothetical protein [Ochrovirga pacifica]|uniref:hypothetical protein n=1 Tax=Ochrovirga pacifica TaxID=1042376 RepID=UPI00025594ED|nr:hypothetical protein [Ochrovirga pacifica]